MRRRHSILPIAFAASLLGGCLGSFGTPGEGTGTSTGTGSGNGTGSMTGSGDGSGNGAQSGGGDGSGTPTPAPTPMPPAVQGSFTAALDKATDSIRLNETKSYQLTLTPANGLTGGVTLALDNPPAGVSAKFTPATVNITDANPVKVQVDVTVAPDLATPTTSAPVAIKATSGTINASASLGLTIPAELLITIAKGVAIGSAASPNNTAFSGVTTLNVKYVTGMKVTWINNDTINHEIHAQGTANGLGVAHEGGPLMANGGNSYTQTINGKGTINANDTHCHIHPAMIGPQINFQ
jgi:plastocyanin